MVNAKIKSSTYCLGHGKRRPYSSPDRHPSYGTSRAASGSMAARTVMAEDSLTTTILREPAIYTEVLEVFLAFYHFSTVIIVMCIFVCCILYCIKSESMYFYFNQLVVMPYVMGKRTTFKPPNMYLC